MKLSLSCLLLALSFSHAAPLEKRATVQGFDISHYQGTVDFKSAYSSGARFVIIKVPLSSPSPSSYPPPHSLTTFNPSPN